MCWLKVPTRSLFTGMVRIIPFLINHRLIGSTNQFLRALFLRMKSSASSAVTLASISSRSVGLISSTAASLRRVIMVMFLPCSMWCKFDLSRPMSWPTSSKVYPLLFLHLRMLSPIRVRYSVIGSFFRAIFWPKIA